MADVDYIELALAMPKHLFVVQCAGVYLVKRPKRVATPDERRIGFGLATAAETIDFDPLADQWQVWRVAKRPGNPFPDQVTVGRATNCDVVLRIPCVSKVQMHILHNSTGCYSLRDCRPSNPTTLNRVSLKPGETRALELGDTIQFGAFELEFVDAARLYEVVRRQGC
jgi:hypothetical protein